MGIALLDSSIVIGALNRDDAIHEAASQAVRVERDRHSLAISALTYAEILVGPCGWEDAVEVVDRFAASVADHRPRTRHRQARRRTAGGSRACKLPDAVIVATGLRIGRT
jgi:predicted nucleic acid-binding protein